MNYYTLDKALEYLEEGSLPRIIIPKYLYHGSNALYKTLKCNGIDLGNSFQSPGWSLYTFTDKEYAIGWAIFTTIKNKIWKYIEYDPLGCIGSNIALLSEKTYSSLINNLDRIPISEKQFYVYTIVTKNDYEYGLGHSSNTPKCITIRTDSDVPIYNVDKYTLTKDMINKYCKVSNKEYTKTEYGMNSRLATFFMKYDFMYNKAAMKVLNKAIRSGELVPGDDVVEFLKSRNVKLETPSIAKRISDKMHNESTIYY